MFTHQSFLRPVLRPEHYASADHHRLELVRLFRPAWHPVGVTGQLALPGDFLTFNLQEDVVWWGCRLATPPDPAPAGPV